MGFKSGGSSNECAMMRERLRELNERVARACDAGELNLAHSLNSEARRLALEVWSGATARATKTKGETRMLASEKVVVAAPMSFTGSAARLWKMRRIRPETWARVLLAMVAIVLIIIAWTVVLAWYLLFGVLLVPYRLVRRDQRRRKRQTLQHRELLNAMRHGRGA